MIAAASSSGVSQERFVVIVNSKSRARRFVPVATACPNDPLFDEQIAPFDDLDGVVVEKEDIRQYAPIRTFENLNAREEFQAAAERLRAE